MASNPVVSYPAVSELLMRHGIPPHRARTVAMNELRLWKPEEVEAILRKLTRPSHNYCPLKLTEPDPDESFLRRHFPKVIASSFVKPPLGAIRQAVRDKKALCVNKFFEFKLCDGDYMAISHVWNEGIRADFKGRGLTRQHLTRIFEAISLTGASWIWLDVLAVPNADPKGLNLSEEEKSLQIEVINTLPQVYSNASAVVVLDALLLQVHPSSALDVAVVMVCGTWLTRVWTYQEIRLAKTALFVTAERVFSLEEIRADLAKHLASDGERDPKASKVSDLSLSMGVLQYVGGIGLSLADIAVASANRRATYEIDYSRSLFAVVGLKWDAKWMTSSEGMQAIYLSRKRDASRLVAMYGAKRLSVSPRWAPSRLSGLEGRIEGGMKWEDRGLRGTWYTAKIAAADELESATRRSMQCRLPDPLGDYWCEILIGPDEEAQTVQKFKSAVNSGRAFLLCTHEISEGASYEAGRRAASNALVVDAANDCKEDEEVDVLFAVALTDVVGKSSPRQISVVLKH